MAAVADCLFCKIVAGEIPATVIRENERLLVFQDINPQAPTHVLVVPKAHHRSVAEIASDDPELAAEILREAASVAAEEGVAEPGYRIVINTGPAGGQTVDHVHAHVLGGRGMGWPPG
ncbi:MAG: histidine triad nucleotide-binding protein [Streptomycetales bacterium]